VPTMRADLTGAIAAFVLSCGLQPSAAAPPGLQPGRAETRYHVRYVVPPNALNQLNGIALDPDGGLFICAALYNRVVHLDPGTGALRTIADETDPVPIQAPDDVAVDAAGNLFVTSILGRNVIRMSRHGGNRRVVATGLGDGASLPNGIAFNAEGRLFATDLDFADPTHPGGLWELDPAGLKPPVPVVRLLPAPNGFAFGPDGKAYVPEMFGGRIDVVDVDARTVATLVGGFGYLVALKLDSQGRLVVLETDTGRVWRVDRVTGRRTVLAEGPPGLDNLVVAPDGTIYVTNFVQGNVWRVDEATRHLDPLWPDRSLAMPFSVSEAPDGSLLVGDFTAVSRVQGDQVTRVSRLLVDGLQMFVPAVAQIGSDLYFSDFLPPDGRIVRLHLDSGRREQVATGFGFPWTVREGEAGHLLVVDQALGTVSDVDPGNGVKVPLLEGLRSPSGLAVDAARRTIYVSDTGAGRVVAVGLADHRSRVFARGLAAPEGVAVDGAGSVLVVEGDAGRLVRIDTATRARRTLADGLPTRTAGVGLPGLNYSSDVLVRADGSIVVTGDANGSLIELTR